MTAGIEPEEQDGFRLVGWRDAVRSVAVEARPALEFRLASAWRASVRFNLVGWLVRGLLLVAVAVVGTPAGWVWVMLAWLAALIGWLLAGLDLFGEQLAERWRVGVAGRFADHLQQGRGVAAWNLPAVLENGGAVALWLAFGLPPLRELGASGTATGLVLVSAFGAVLVAQIVTDAGYYNANPHQQPRWYASAARWLLVPVYAGVAFGTCLFADLPDATGAWASALSLVLFGCAAVVALVVANSHAAAVSAWLVHSERQRGDMVLTMSGVVHRIGFELSSMADELEGDTAAARKLREAFTQFDVLSERVKTKELDEPLPLGRLLELVGRKHFGPGVEATAGEHAGVVLTEGGTTVLLQVVLDLVANAAAAGATSTTVEVDVDVWAHPTARLSVTVTDNGTGFDGVDPKPAPGSSRDVIQRLCARRGGELAYALADRLTVARATFDADVWQPVLEEA